ncbi:MAG: type II secretion system protein GspC [Thiotrichaceae bacterium]|nr:type II secretion system protein GspC [Thiotrichaceae bacterium]
MRYGLLKRLLWNKYWIVLINLLLSAFLGYQLVFTGLQSYKPLSQPLPVAQPSSGNVSTAAKSSEPALLNLSPILEARLFGEASQSNNSTARTTTQIPPDTKLSLKLLGIYHNPDPQQSLAMIGTAENKSGLYHIGKAVSNGVILSEVYPKYVILQRGDRYETLRLAGTGNNPALHPVAPQNLNKPSPARQLGNLQRQLATNPEALGRLLRVDPANENGKFIGFKLSAGQDPSLMAQFDLQTGDILTSVNGIELDSPLKGFSIVQQLSTANQLTLQIMRQGQSRTLSFNIEK